MNEGLTQLGFRPDIDFVLRDTGDGAVYIGAWLSNQPQPSGAEIEAAHAEWQAEYNAQEYARNRAQAYASVGDQLDMQYWDNVNGTTTWRDHITEVKARHPK